MKNSLDKIPLFFIISKARSGSTLAQSVLDAHPNICATIESRFVLHLHSKYHSITNWNDTIINNFIKDVFTDRAYRLFWGTNEIELKNLFSNYHITNFSDACKVVYLSYHSMFEKKEIRAIVDKNPSHAKFMPELMKIFPDAKFIHLIRDPRAVITSNRIAFGGNVVKITQSWVLLNGLIESKKNDISFLTIKYEDLVKTPEISFELIFNFLNVAFTKEVLNAHSTVKNSIDQNNYYSLKHHSNVSTRINTKSIDSWKSKLSEKELNSINYMTANVANKYGYDIIKPILNTTELKEINKSIKPLLLNIKIVVLFYKIPFLIRKNILNLKSLFFDKKYKK